MQIRTVLTIQRPNSQDQGQWSLASASGQGQGLASLRNSKQYSTRMNKRTTNAAQIVSCWRQRIYESELDIRYDEM